MEFDRAGAGEGGRLLRWAAERLRLGPSLWADPVSRRELVEKRPLVGVEGTAGVDIVADYAVEVWVCIALDVARAAEARKLSAVLVVTAAVCGRWNPTRLYSLRVNSVVCRSFC